MRQITTFEQAKRLHRFGIEVSNHYYMSEKFLHRGNYCNKHRFPAPTIGELIEWIDENGKGFLSMNSFDADKRHWDVSMVTGALNADDQNELIDALVDLAIKIKEQGK
jgi:hypothetical protein